MEEEIFIFEQIIAVFMSRRNAEKMHGKNSMGTCNGSAQTDNVHESKQLVCY